MDIEKLAERVADLEDVVAILVLARIVGLEKTVRRAGVGMVPFSDGSTGWWKLARDNYDAMEAVEELVAMGRWEEYPDNGPHKDWLFYRRTVKKEE